MKHSVAFINIDYDEGVSGSYRAVVLRKPNGKIVRFATGDPGEDLSSARRAAGFLFLESSSLTHFVFDDENWRFDEYDNLIRVSP